MLSTTGPRVGGSDIIANCILSGHFVNYEGVIEARSLGQVETTPVWSGLASAARRSRELPVGRRLDDLATAAALNTLAIVGHVFFRVRGTTSPSHGAVNLAAAFNDLTSANALNDLTTLGRVLGPRDTNAVRFKGSHFTESLARRRLGSARHWMGAASSGSIEVTKRARSRSLRDGREEVEAPSWRRMNGDLKEIRHDRKLTDLKQGNDAGMVGASDGRQS
jgi:hypothetical protein